MTYSPEAVFCDYLSVTYSPVASMVDEARLWLLNAGAYTSYSEGRKHSLRFPQCSDGLVHLEESAAWARVSASGQILSHLRSHSLYDEFLSLLADEPHRVTRLDAALDVPFDGADVVPALYRSFLNGSARLSHKPLPVTVNLRLRPSDLRETGTLYIGTRGKAKITAAVYDKAFERFDKHGLVIPPTTRYELRFAGIDCSLRDAADPRALFWKYASPGLLSIPPGYDPPAWVSGDNSYDWSYQRSAPTSDQRLSYRVETSLDLHDLARLAVTVGPRGRERLDYLIRKRLDALFEADLPADSITP